MVAHKVRFTDIVNYSSPCPPLMTIYLSACDLSDREYEKEVGSTLQYTNKKCFYFKRSIYS